MMNGTPTIRVRYLLRWFCQILVGSENCSSGLKTVHSMRTSRWAGIYFQWSSVQAYLTENQLLFGAWLTKSLLRNRKSTVLFIRMFSNRPLTIHIEVT